MKIFVASILAYYKKKGIELNFFVIQNSELGEFLIHLESIKSHLPDNTRFQILLFNKHNKHWSLLDVKVNHSQLSFYLLDAAFYSNLETLLKIDDQGFFTVLISAI